MGKLPVLLTAGALMMLLGSPAVAYELEVYSENGQQDLLILDGWVCEVGDGFPTGEVITSSWWYTDETACFDGSDDSEISNVMVEITRVDISHPCPIGPTPVWYVADPETTITNFDGWIGNAGLSDAEEAFLIDSVGINRPLVYESMGQNDLLEPGETWQFIIQDFSNTLGGPPAPFDSLGIASLSSGWPPSTGSLLVPEPVTLVVLALGGLALRRRRSR